MLSLLALVAIRASAHARQSALQFFVQAPSLHRFTGKVVIYLGEGPQEPRFGPNWFNPKPCYSEDFTNADLSRGVAIDDAHAVGFPGKLSALAPGSYEVQAVVDLNLGGRAIGSSPGNLYSQSTTLNLDPKTSGRVSFVCDRVVPEQRLQETDRIKEFRVQSALLSDWYKRPTYIKSAVVLPEGYSSDRAKKYPVIFEIPGFGGGATRVGNRSLSQTLKDGEPFLFVILDPNCPTGHCVFADSANNGPWGKALTTEFIPAFEKQFRTYGVPATRFVTGHSSGGWSSLWLQVAYPDVFGGVWSTSPDPVDFRDFQRIDLYQPGVNMFTDPDGKPRPLARRGLEPVLFYKAFSDMERPIRGEQLGSFEAVFSPRGKDGQPEKLWDRDTGAVNMDVARAWQKYDIDLKLRTEWKQIGPKLAGKLHVFTGDIDTFYLEGAVRLLKTDMALLGSDAEIEVWPGDHGSVMTPRLIGKIDKEMADTFRKWRASNGG